MQISLNIRKKSGTAHTPKHTTNMFYAHRRSMKYRTRTMRCGAAALLAIFAGGCASPAKITAVDAYAPPSATAIETARLEQFDPSPWPDAPLDTLTAVVHDVPARLMEGRAAEGLEAQVPGFRVQIFSSIERDETLEAQENVQTWWREQHEEGALPEDLFPEGLPVHSVYSQPYYRIRVGDFLSREEARTLHAVLARRFTDAFIVPDTILITR